MSKSYPVGTRLWFVAADVTGVVVENYKFSGDVCVDWSNGQSSSYDDDFLNEHCKKIGKP